MITNNINNKLVTYPNESRRLQFPRSDDYAQYVSSIQSLRKNDALITLTVKVRMTRLSKSNRGAVGCVIRVQLRLREKCLQEVRTSYKANVENK